MYSFPTQVFVASISPARDVDAEYIAYGHSMCVDPWGCLVAEADEKEQIVYAEIGKGYYGAALVAEADEKEQIGYTDICKGYIMGLPRGRGGRERADRVLKLY